MQNSAAKEFQVLQQDVNLMFKFDLFYDRFLFKPSFPKLHNNDMKLSQLKICKNNHARIILGVQMILADLP